MRQLLASISFLLLFVALEGCLPTGSGSITSKNPPEGYIDILPGESLTLSVRTANSPEDTVKWYIDGTLVAQGHNYVFELPLVYAKNTFQLEAKASSSPLFASNWTMRVKGRLWSHINHLALSVVDVQATLALYVDLFGYLPNGGTGNYGGLQGDIAGVLQGFDGSVESVSLWANDRNPKFQMEFTEYGNPQARPAPADLNPSDIGMRRVGIWVQDFDATLNKLAQNNLALITTPKDYGNGRRVCVKDPNGIYLEILENDLPDNPSLEPGFSHTQLPVRTRALTMSVPNLEQAEAYYKEHLGMEAANFVWHTSPMEELCGLSGASTKTSLLWGGNNFLLELVEYVSPQGSPRPADWHIGDAGVVHIGLTFDQHDYLVTAYDEAIAAGYSFTTKPFQLLDILTVTFMKTDEDFLIEYLKPTYSSAWGYLPTE